MSRLSTAQQLEEHPDGLSERELSIMQEIADGYSYSEAAATLNLGVETVKQTMFRLARKMEARNGHHAVITAIRQGLID